MRAVRHLNRPTTLLRASFCSLALAAVLAGLVVTGNAQTDQDDGFITGVVSSRNGPEAGVWVIAETEETETKLVKIVVTDDDGRFVLPQLPEVTYDVWVRGYGLVDSTPVSASPGEELTLRTTVAATPQEAAQVYPVRYV